MMADFAQSDHPGVKLQLERLARLSPGGDILGLDRILELLRRLDDPHHRLPPVIHVAGTNGKGSTCAFLRSSLEAAGLSAHVYTSPHLVRFNERIRLAGRLIGDDLLAECLRESIDAAGHMEVSFFEATTAAAFLAFAASPADACIIEVGLGGRLDATNVIERPLVSAIAQLGIDHPQFLGSRLEQIAAEKAGIAKKDVPLVTLAYPETAARAVMEAAAAAGAPWFPRASQWDAAIEGSHIAYRDEAGRLDLPLPRLPGAHQAVNAALAVAILRRQDQLAVPPSALRAAMGWAEWPARLQKLGPGPLRALLPAEAELWLDGAHNPNAARAVADYFRANLPAGRPLHLVFGLLANKDAPGVLRPFRGRSLTLHALEIPGHASHAPDALVTAARALGLAAMPAANVHSALRWIANHADPSRPPVVLVLGSLYLAGEVLRENDQLPS
jgi:dihydrofolate synthase/folylpolyglutamate synthase